MKAQLVRAIAASLRLLAFGGALLQPATVAAPAPGKPAFTFRNTAYFHRWSQNTQHEFTPAKQEDLKAWTDMITINIYPDVKDGDALAARANGVLEGYNGAKAMLLNRRSVPRTLTKPAEHFIAVAFGQPTFIEVAFTRLKLVDGVGCAVVYSYRIYGEKIGDVMDAWLKANGPDTEKALTEWNAIDPAVTLARNLGRAKS